MANFGSVTGVQSILREAVSKYSWNTENITPYLDRADGRIISWIASFITNLTLEDGATKLTLTTLKAWQGDPDCPGVLKSASDTLAAAAILNAATAYTSDLPKDTIPRLNKEARGDMNDLRLGEGSLVDKDNNVYQVKPTATGVTVSTGDPFERDDFGTGKKVGGY